MTQLPNHEGSLLGQLRPANTTAASIFSPDRPSRIETIIVTNVGAASATYRIFWDNNGTTYDETTALYWDITLPSGSTDTIPFRNPLPMGSTSSNLAVRTSVSSGINFSVFGTQKVM